MSVKCLACGSEGLQTILSLGKRFAANLLFETCATTAAINLELLACPVCGHAQQADFYSPELLFSDYLYASGTSRGLTEYFRFFAPFLARFSPAGSNLLELASNDGSFLREASKAGFACSGVDPSARMSERARRQGLFVETGFWPDVPRPKESVDVLVAQNVLAHVPDPLRFATAVAESLSDSGFAVFQTSQLNMVKNGEFDTIYHEHYSFFSYLSITTLLRRAGLISSAPYIAEIHGGSLLVFAARNSDRVEEIDSVFLDSSLPPDAKIQRLSDAPQPTLSDWRQFASKARIRLAEFADRVASFKALGFKVVLVGAAAKADTFIATSGATIEHILDEAEDKIGLRLPNVNVRVDHLNEARHLTGPCLFIIGAWNFQEEIREKLIRLRPPVGDVGLVYFPELQTWNLHD